MTGHLARPIAVAAVVVALLSVAAVSPAAASHKSDSNPIDEILTEEDDEGGDGWVDKAKGYVPTYIVEGMAIFDGQLQRFYSGFSINPLSDDTPSNAELASEFSAAVAENSATYEAFLTAETGPSKAYDTHRITFDHADSEAQTVYLVGSVDNGSYEDVTVLSEAEFDETGRTVDEEWVVVGDGAKEFPALTKELAKRIDDDREIDRTLRAQLIGRYCDVTNPMGNTSPDDGSCEIRSTLWMDHEAVPN
ncbi:hypothetical protein [Halosolutus gelatinilyticus]|uniref:hypothetical protein n=1 Tax=Halosolutus gelatinilyticus TaxID=2931975 RepID=UPI001FF67767|nr:hypothetical protein [Halosolutus gelatinilyticus]